MKVDRKHLMGKIEADLNVRNQATLARLMGLNLMTLNRIVRKKSVGSIETWEKIAEFYSSKRHPGRA